MRQRPRTSAPRAASLRCVMTSPQGGKRTQGPTQRINSTCNRILLWKTCGCPDVFANSVVLRIRDGAAQKEKTRPGGQPDGSSHMGAWGGWALAPDIAMGRDDRSHMHWSPDGPTSFKGVVNFFGPWRAAFGAVS